MQPLFVWHPELTGSALTPANPPSAPASSAAGVDCSGPASGSADRARRARPGDYTTSASRRRRRRWCACQPPARLATPTLFCSPCAIVWRPGRLRASLYSLAPFLLSRCRAEDRVRRPPSCCSWRSTTSREGKYLEQPRRRRATAARRSKMMPEDVGSASGASLPARGSCHALDLRAEGCSRIPLVPQVRPPARPPPAARPRPPRPRAPLVRAPRPACPHAPLPRRVRCAALTPPSTPLRAQDAAMYRVGTFALVAGKV